MTIRPHPRRGTAAAALLLATLLAAPLAAQAPPPASPPAKPGPPTEPSGQRAGQAAAATGTQPVGPPVAEDHSLTPDAYKAKGMPAIDKPWSDAEYLAAARTLEGILTADPTQLPRYGSPTSGKVFARMVAIENLAPLEKKRALADQRLNQAGRYGNSVQQLMSIYARAVNQYKKTFDAELLELSAFNLELADQLRVIVDQLVHEIAGNDPQHSAREQVRDRTDYSFVAVIDGALAAFPQHFAYRTDELIRYAGRLAEVLPRLYPVLPPNAKRDLPERFQKLADAEQDPNLKAALLAIKDKLK